MAFNNDQKEFPLPAGDNNPKRKSEQHLPKYFRTSVNSKFLSSTLDQMLQPGVAEKLNGFVGRQTARAFTSNDSYIGDVSKSREDYQFEPAAVIRDELGNVEFYKDYNDYINQIRNFKGSVSDHSLLNSQEFYAWDPHIDWDKFTNFREYYWLPTGPQSVPVRGQTADVVSTYTVTLADNLDNYGYVFSPDGQTQNPTLKLYRGITYRFEINTPGLPFTIRTARTLEDEFLLEEGISAQTVEDGVIEIEFGPETPNVLYYVADNDINTAGLIKVANIEEASFIDVDAEIVGKKTYKTGNNIELSNGMKIYFIGEVIPESYAEGEYYVEGVGDKIRLIKEDRLSVASSFAQDLLIEFDAQGFDRVPFDEAIGYPAVKDYIVVNRASLDGNLWSRYNRWFHRSVIEKSAELNGQVIEVDQSQRAKRPIIEFEAGLKLHQFGTFAKDDVDLVDNFTTDVFSTVEGAAGYNIDGVDVTDGMRILFLADPDILVRGKIFEVNFINFSSGRATNRQISLVEVADTDALDNEVVLVKNGTEFKGRLFYYNGLEWNLTQNKTSVNQPPLFDVFDDEGFSYFDGSTYEATTFSGNRVFSYKEGRGVNDSELGFPLSYRNIENVGDITFNFDLLSGNFNFTSENELYYKNTDIGYLRHYDSREDFTTVNGWKTASKLSSQTVIRQYVFDNTQTSFAVDVYNDSGTISDLWIRVYLNNKLQFENVDYVSSVNLNNVTQISFTRDLTEGDVVQIKTQSSSPKNENGIYEIAANLERNPLNNNLTEFTLGEVNDHVNTIVEQIDGFNGIYPGAGNLRDLGSLTEYGRRFVKHTGPMNLALYHLLDKDANIVKALRYARREYGKFKRVFLQTANELGYDGPVKEHVDRIMKSITKDKVKTMPFFFSDMVPTGATTRNEYEIEDLDQAFFALNSIFDLSTPSRLAVQVYQNGVQLVHGKDYTFNSEGFCVVTATKSIGDIIEIYEYETTNGSYVPPTPTKLGLYPAYEPQIFIDNTYQTPTKIIQGHDGSRTVAYNDFRDGLILELEKRIYNNIKVAYDTTLVDVHSFVPGIYRNTGFSKSQIDNSMLPDFVQWLQLVDEDYTTNSYFQRSNTFTFNYVNSTSPNNVPLSGFWRAVYKQAYDTDRPHTHPWEMLGFSIKPTWWEDQYGPAPYTKDNLLLWEDLENGIVRIPGQKFRVNKKYVRPGLTTHIPVDESGNLLSPNDSGYVRNYTGQSIKNNYTFGDHAPVETAWRNSSEYPFALITAWTLNQPNKIFGVGFDRIRQVRNIVNQIVYKDTKNHVRLEDLVFPNTIDDAVQTFTSGLVNYIVGYLTSNVTTPVKTYKDKIVRVQNQIGFKLAGYTDKTKFKLILDSRTPLNQGNVFVPDENYQIILNTSSPIDILSYSGVVIEKQPSGFIIRGYDNTDPVFNYFRAIPIDNDPVINVGGISEPFVSWATGKYYTVGTNVEYDGNYYRVTTTHTSTNTFDGTKFARLPSLPLIGGREAVFRRRFYETEVSKLAYGTKLATIQDVVDFLLGYEQYLNNQGFVFDYFDTNSGVVTDWRTSAKEFMFWTTQNWSAGSIITLSPAAFRVTLNTEYSVVDNIFDTFYGYTLLKADGKRLVEEFSSLARQNPNEFVLTTKNTEDGIYSVKLPLVQKEHVVLLDNRTVFGDIIYDPEPGYRQERIRVLGYRTTEWDGSLNIPGFVYDNAIVTEWESWKDYAIGEVVKYKEFYYTANTKVPGAETFNSRQWNRLAEKPEAKLLPNFEYKTNQFADFYDLDTDNFDIEQQKFAQHLIGYQNRQYLANIINDDVSQYKFYQGMIQDKGTRNALDKLFDVLSSADKDSLDFYEEWAIKSGQYGAAEGFDEVEFLLDESKFRLAPQPVELVDRITGEETDLVYRIRPFEVYLKPNSYDHKPFPTKFVIEGYTKNSGYVNPEDVQFIVSTYNDILTLNFENFKRRNYVWVGNEDLSWNVYQHVTTDLQVESVIGGTTELTLVLNSTPADLAAGDIIGVYDLINIELSPDDSSYDAVTQTTSARGKFYKVRSIELNNVILENDQTVEDINRCAGKITALVSVRAADLNAVNAISQTYGEPADTYWVDDDLTGRWTVLKNNQPFNLLQAISNETVGKTQNYGVAIAANKSNTYVAVGAPDDDNGKVYIYRRGSDNSNLQLIQTLGATDFFADDLQRFGATLSMSEDGQYLIVGSPNASNVKTNFKNEFVEATDYSEGDIVSYQEGLWKALADIEGQVDSIQFTSFDSVVQIIDALNIEADDSEKIPVILTGNYPIPEVETDHILIRAPLDMYNGSAEGDDVQLVWNTLTIGYQDQETYVAREPFLGAIPEVDSNFITDSHTIQKKVDAVLYVDSFTNEPVIGQRVETANAFGTVTYTFNSEGRLTIYLRDVNGTFDLADSLFTADGDFVGEYEQVAPAENINIATVWGGYWLINTDSNYTTGQEDSTIVSLSDEGRGLIYKDVITDASSDSTDRYYYNILDYNTDVVSSENTLNSYIRILSFEGNPGPSGISGETLDSRFVIRAPKPVTDTLTVGEEFDFYMPTLARYGDATKNDPTLIGLSYNDLNKKLTVDDLWDGYIFFEFTKFDGNGNPFEPRVGDTVRDVTTGATAQVRFYQRNGLNVTIFVDSVTGNWSQGDDYGNNAEIEFLGTPSDPSPIYQVSRVMGQIQYRSLGLDSEEIGKLIVVDRDSNIPVPNQDILLDTEYWFYNEEDTVLGVARPASIPGEGNNDWQQVFSIPTSLDGVASGLSKEGMYSIYFRGSTTQFSLVNAYTVPDRANNLYLGSDVQLSKFNDLYRGFVYAAGQASDATFKGRIYFLKQGTDARGNAWSWEYAKDKQFKGEFRESQNYFEGDIVYRDTVLYRALTNISAGTFVNSDWDNVDESLDYIGYVPNDTALLPVFDSAETSTVLDQGALVNFGNAFDSTTDSSVIANQGAFVDYGSAFDTSADGEVLVTIAKYSTDKPNVAVIYRNFNGNYQRSQTLPAPSNTIGFGESIAISADGTVIAVGAPYDDEFDADQGTVFVYIQVNGVFELTQTLRSRNNEKNEQFGYTVQFDGDTLAVCAKVADGFEETTFDNESLVLDGGFTKFKRAYSDSGVIYLYERINNSMVYGQTIDYDDSTVFDFGRFMLANQNHIYVGLPRVETATGRSGTLVDFRKVAAAKIWETLRSPKDTVDLSKIKRVMLYDTKENRLLTYLDYIDPIQGKIAGPAEQEIRYKMYTDPAVYTTGPTSLSVNPTNSWGPEQVGQVWWDLTNTKFLNPYQGNVIFSANNWNTLFAGNSIDVYEWVETKYTPAEWDRLADTEEGITRGVSGTARYGESAYVQKRVFDSVAQTFSNKYYFWVRNKVTVPNVDGRSISIRDVTQLIENPAAQGYRYVNLINDSSFVLHNCDSLIKGTDVALSIQYWNIEDQRINIHNEYKIVTEGLESSLPSRDIERKWFDSLVGYDSAGRIVPSPELSPKEKYGILNRPRQSWFVNKTEALKQVIDRVNRSLKQNLIVDDKNISRLFENDPAPSAVTRQYDASVDTLADLDFVGVARARQAVLTPVVEDGKIVRVVITDSGRGYLVAPTLAVEGLGTGAEIELTINSVGAITSAEVINQGTGYGSNTRITVRKFTVLVRSDETILGKWALYERNTATRGWYRIESQAHDVRLFWNYIDWYADGYSEFTDIDFLINEAYELQSLNDTTGDVVKIANIGTGGWLLLEKIDNQETPDYAVNYKTVGRQNGTIQFKSTLYDYILNAVGYDSISYDTKFFDSEPTIEARVILETIRDDLFIDELAIEYNALFFASLRYVFSEQTYVDWAFKTSFVKAKHNVGLLRQDITFNNDNLPSYEDYIEEVKPYKTKLREYISDYDAFDNSRSVVTDFDLPPAYSTDFSQILPKSVKVVDSALTGTDSSLESYPNKNWLDNVAYKVVAVNIADGGSGYTNPPTVEIAGGGGSGATAKAFLGRNGSISRVEVTNQGTGYLGTPSISVNGSQEATGSPARLNVELGGGLVRSLNTTIKFDRTTGVFHITKISETETFAGTGNKYLFNLIWPMDLRNTTVSVTVNGQLALSSNYVYRNKLDTSKGYNRYHGVIEFTMPPRDGATIVVEYNKSVELLQAQDRVNLFYNPTTGQFANDLAQLMDGIDYGGVEIKSFNFGGPNGWDTDKWYAGNWDVYDNTYDDQIFVLDGSTLALDLYTPLENGVVYNIYKNGVRIDDPDYNGSPTNPAALMPSVTGDGTQQTINLGDYDVPANAGDTFIVRRVDSDGSFLPDPESYDTIIEGGNLAYSTATGLNAEDINIDGDGFVTPTTSKGPEELVPGQILDSVDITVYERPTTGSSNIYTRNYIGDGSTKTFAIEDSLITNESLFVKINYSIINSTEYEIDNENQTVTFDTAPTAGSRINLTWLDVSGENILDIDSFVSDGSTTSFLTNVRWTENISYIVTINGVEIPSVIIESDETYELPGNVVIQLAEPALEGNVVRFALFTGDGSDDRNFSQVTIDQFVADGSTTQFELTQTPFSQEPSQFYTLVKVNDNILYAGYNQKFAVSTTREYQLDRWQAPVGTLNNWDLEVYLNGRKLQFLQEWSFLGGGTFDSSLDPDDQPGSTVVLAAGVGIVGDELQVFVISDGEYRYGFYETDDDSSNAFTSTPGIINLDSAYNAGDTVTVYQFSNNSSQGIDRSNYFVVERTVLTIGSENYYQLRRLRNGLVDLRSQAVDSQYVWVTVNRRLLNPNVDYVVTENKRYVQILGGLNENDIVETFHFANVPLKNKFGWRQFKDMLNRTHYKRLDGTKNYKLARDLNWYDRNIELFDATNLPAPAQGTKTPGVVWIEGERIEYFVKQGNVLKQLRRGTLGTGVKNVYEAGTELYDQSADQTMPYKDETVTTIFTADGTTNQYTLDFEPETVNEFEVFVAGRRLRKNSIDAYQFEERDTAGTVITDMIAQDSPEGDVTLAAEFSIEGNVLTVADTPTENTKVIVIRRRGKRWTDPGTPLSNADTDIGRFLRSTQVDLPR